MAATCLNCGNTLDEDERFVLVSGPVRRVHCSESCLQASMRAVRRAHRAARRRWQVMAGLAGLAVIGFIVLSRSRQAPSAGSIVSGPPPDLVTDAAGPRPFGPPWPPSDAFWSAEFAQASWVYPLPGPLRRAPVADRRIFGPERPADRPSQCRSKNRCGIDLGGELWGEHVYAAHDGVVERVHRGSGDEHADVYVRLSHWGRMVFTQYYHLAAIPRGIGPGVHVKAGDVIGLVGDTGSRNARPHLYFSISIRPSSELPEVYWDPEPLIVQWPLRQPTHGSVAGLVSLAGPPAHVAGEPAPRKHPHPRPRKKGPAEPEPKVDESESGAAPD
ncbi:MAG TPA: M23 family metallopeptidase [Polyangia bacterium]|nr:M23 family metallopeptidase [Polyangia bacterium]